MLSIVIPETELWDGFNLCFIPIKEQTLRLEHSLVSVSKWEARWNKPFMSETEKNLEEIIDYIKCMTITQNVDPNVYSCLTNGNILRVEEYIQAPMTAFRFPKAASGIREILTSEVIYYYMIELGIPFECQKWHLNRLLSLIRVCALKRQPPKKMSKREIMLRNSELNEERKKRMNSKG